jgi:hypothetical protein
MPKHLAVAILGSLALSVACSARPVWTILRPDHASALSRQCSRSFPADLSDSWNPGKGDVERAEPEVTKSLSAAFERIPPRYRERSPGEYYRQYAGFLRGSKRVLYVNGVRKAAVDEMAKFEPESARWTDHPVMMCDGGTDFFGAVFDLETGRVTEFDFNGPHPPTK